MTTDDRSAILRAHAAGDMTTEDAIRALMGLDPPAPESPPSPRPLDEHILAQISATPEVLEECLHSDHGIAPGTLSHDDLLRVGTAMYNDPEVWASHNAALVRALSAVAPVPSARALAEDAETKMRQMVDFAWSQIARDLDLPDGIHPHDTRHFSTLHDQCDANQYLIDAAEEYGVAWGGDVDPDPGFDALNTLSNRLDAMLKARAGIDVRFPFSGICPGCEKGIGPWEDSHWCVEGGGTLVHDDHTCQTEVGCTCIFCDICTGTDVHMRACPHFAEQFPPEDYPELYPTNQTQESN